MVLLPQNPKSEIRMPKEFRNPKSEAVPGPSPVLPSAEKFAGFLALPNWLTRQLIDAGFGLRTSGLLRHSDFGFRISIIACLTEAPDL